MGWRRKKNSDCKVALQEVTLVISTDPATLKRFVLDVERFCYSYPHTNSGCSYEFIGLVLSEENVE